MFTIKIDAIHVYIHDFFLFKPRMLICPETCQARWRFLLQTCWPRRKNELNEEPLLFWGFGANFTFPTSTLIAVAMNFLHWHGKWLYKNAFQLFQMKNMQTQDDLSRWCVFIISITTYTVFYNPKYTKRALCKPGKDVQTPTDTLSFSLMWPSSSQYHNK